MIEQFEHGFSGLIGAKYAYSFWKGRVALHAILKSAGIGPGDEVILPAFTCVVVPNAVSFVGATPVFVDIGPADYNLDPQQIERLITRRTRALLVQHTYGIPAALDSLLAIAKRHNLIVIEDCAHSLGSRYRGRHLGTFGDAAFFSSQWSKPFTTGLGGVAVTSNPELGKSLRAFQQQFVAPSGKSLIRLRVQHEIYRRLYTPRLYWRAVGVLRGLSRLNLFVPSSGKKELERVMPRDTFWRMSEFQSKIGLKRLSGVEEMVEHRVRLAQFYEEALRSRGWPVVPGLEQTKTVYLRYPVRVGNKWELLEKASTSRIELGSWFESVLHPIRDSLELFGYEAGRCPLAELAANESVNLPTHPGVTESEAERILGFVLRYGTKTGLHDSSSKALSATSVTQL